MAIKVYEVKTEMLEEVLNGLPKTSIIVSISPFRLSSDKDIGLPLFPTPFINLKADSYVVIVDETEFNAT